MLFIKRNYGGLESGAILLLSVVDWMSTNALIGIDPAKRILNATASGRNQARVRLRQSDMDILLLCVADQFFQALLASDPRLLVAAKRGSGKMPRDLIHPDVTGLHRGSSAVRSSQIVGPNRARQTVIERVYRTNHCGFIVPAKHGEYRAEYLLAGNSHFGRNVHKHSRIDEEAVCQYRVG